MRFKIKIKDMAMPLSKAKAILENQEDAFSEHFTKICIWKNETNDLNGWIRTLAIICSNVGGLEVKTKSGKLSKKDYINYFFDIINEWRDIDTEFSTILLAWGKTNPDIIYYEEPSKEEFIKYFNIYNKLKEELLPKFLEKERKNISQYISILTEFFNRNLN